MTALDSNIFIYALEADAVFGETAMAILANNDVKIASELAVAEVLASPVLHDTALRDQVEQFLETVNVRFVPVNKIILKTAAELRRTNGTSLKLVDAIHLATALTETAGCFVTNDSALHRVKCGNLLISGL